MNGPTKLTLLRIALIPFILIFSYMDSPWNSWVSLAIFLIASLTDWLDGYLARKNNQITMLGKLLDPLADKLLVLTAFLVILEHRFVPAWLVIFMIGREMAITGLRAFLAAERIVLAAGQTGKWKMTFQVIALSFLFVGGVSDIFLKIGLYAAYAALLLSLVSAYLYVAKFWALLGEKIMAEQNQKGSQKHGQSDR
ncbi:CDP-diacylglycerol--glycerol-3-phosphate 3-phosphatidyltransferase [Sulfidibacter corallicola]|uniref:CDP-diacylglycerol--glycerol-3-phosphate 3-phosphatidyltransferase n=1 Tax=Sulfidibacter corallicola TaxID=2818388 RepID=A0A8A4TTB2_SULCO|nr:CDP-diacylglycerol--glycerol-3-phosphate 3-phosphatidyltransferase [Sulfidibacter corallicola]QTD52394.1 CDP-diacylglycerol--glycerol-3-phosphate 3-phosphatidyltransferase [Sulfidibacter corallicola]